MFLICSYFPDWTLQCHKEECQTEYNKNTISFLSFFFFQAAHIGSDWEMFYKKVVLQLCKNQSKNTCKGVQCSIKVARFKFATLLKLNSFTGIFHRFRCNTDAAVYFADKLFWRTHIFCSLYCTFLFKYFCRTSSMAVS